MALMLGGDLVGAVFLGADAISGLYLGIEPVFDAGGASYAMSDTDDTVSAAATIMVDPHWSNVVFLSGFNGSDGATSASDDSASGKAITFAGNAQIDTAQSKFGGASLLLDGSGDGLLLNNSADWQFGTGPFTVEFFYRPAATTDSYIISFWDISGGQKSWLVGRETDATMSFYISSLGSATTLRLNPSTTNANNAWHHCAVERDAAGTYRMWIDGVFGGSVSSPGEVLKASTGKLSIGGYTSAGSLAGGYFNGWLDELRITKGVARYGSNSNIVVPTVAYPRS